MTIGGADTAGQTTAASRPRPARPRPPTAPPAEPVDVVALGLDVWLQAVLAQGGAGHGADGDDPSVRRTGRGSRRPPARRSARCLPAAGLLPRLRRDWPELGLFLREETSQAACDSLHRGQLDCVLLALPFACGEVEAEILFEDRLYVAFPEQGVAAMGAEVRPEEIDEGRLLLLEDGHCLKDHALAACNRPELRAEAAMLGTSLHTLVQMVGNGLGLTLVPEMAVAAGLLEGRPRRRGRSTRPTRPAGSPSSPEQAHARIHCSRGGGGLAAGTVLLHLHGPRTLQHTSHPDICFLPRSAPSLRPTTPPRLRSRAS